MEKPIVCKSQYIPGFIYDVMKEFVDIVVVVIADGGVVRKCCFEKRLSSDGEYEFNFSSEVLLPKDNFYGYYKWWYWVGRWYDKKEQFQRVYYVDGEKIVVR